MLKQTQKVDSTQPSPATAPTWLDLSSGGDHASFESFRPESPSPRFHHLQHRHVRTVGTAIAAAAIALPLGWLGWRTATARPAVVAAAPVAATGTAIFNSVPEGAAITIDGVARGVTPVRVSLAPGAHTVEIVSGSTTKTLPITVEAGNVISQYIEFATLSQGGRLDIGSDPVGAEVRVDGVLKGVTPLTINDVAPGQHRVTVSTGESAVNRVVNVVRGATATIVVSANAPPASAASGGWLTVHAPVEMEILEDGRLIGSTRTDRVMLPVGSHRLEFSNSSLEFSVTRTVQITAGKTTGTAVTLPTGKLSVNAVPWANVTIDGSAVGTTPLGELAVPIGQHEVVFRHPQLGERRQNVTVRAQTPTRIGIDLRK
jgi:hypothetical protein